jgi:hypothetical protein
MLKSALNLTVAFAQDLHLSNTSSVIAISVMNGKLVFLEYPEFLLTVLLEINRIPSSWSYFHGLPVGQL